MEKVIIQISSAQGPVECCRVVARVQEMILNQARKSGIPIEAITCVKGDLNGTLKNLFVGVSVYNVLWQPQWNPNELRFETCRASGPGGQDVNKVETAVRAIHLPSGIRVLASDSRSQLENKQRAIERLKVKVMAWHTEQLVARQQEIWLDQKQLERGNPVRKIVAPLQ